MSLEPFGNITPLERISAKEARELVAAGIKRGLIRLPESGIDSWQAARNYESRMAMRRARSTPESRIRVKDDITSK